MDLLISDKQREDKLVEQVEQLLDEALHYWNDRQSGDSFQYCHMCHEVDSHKKFCPIPALKKWLEIPSPFEEKKGE